MYDSASHPGVGPEPSTSVPLEVSHMKWKLRSLIAALTTLSTVALVLIAVPQPASAATYTPQSSNRSVLNFNTHWLFAGDVPGGAGQATGLDESAFVPVTLPYFRVHPHKGFPKGDFEVPASWY